MTFPNSSRGSASSRRTSSISSGSFEDPQPFIAEDQHSSRARGHVNQDGAYVDTDASSYVTYQSTNVSHEVEEANDKDHAGEKLNAFQLLRQLVIRCLVYLQPDFVIGHLDVESLKVALRTFIGIFVSVLFMSIGPLMTYTGSACYLVSIVLCIEVSGGISISHAFYTSIADMTLCLLSFAINTIAHAINWRIKGYQTAASAMQSLSEQGICAITDTACFMHEVDSGRFLHTKSSVITVIAMMCTFVLCGWIGTKSLLLRIPWVLSSIVCVISGLYMNLLPMFDPWVYGRTIIVPIGFALCVRLALAIILFPFSANSKYVSIVTGGLAGSFKSLSNSVETINKLKPSDPSFEEEVKKWEKTSLSWLKTFAMLGLHEFFSSGEFAYGRFDTNHLSKLRSYTRSIITSVDGCRFFYRLITDKMVFINSRSHLSSVSSKVRDSGSIQGRIWPLDSEVNSTRHKSKRLNKDYAKVGYFDKLRYEKTAEIVWNDMKVSDLDTVFESLVGSYGDLPAKLCEVLSVIVEWVKCANDFRIFSRVYPGEWEKHCATQRELSVKLETALRELESSFEKYGTSSRSLYAQDPQIMNKPYRSFSLELAAFYGCTLQRIMGDLKRMAKYCLYLDEKYPTARVLFPFRKLSAGSAAYEISLIKNLSSVDNGETFYETSFDPTSYVQARDPDSSPPRSVWHLVGKRFKQCLDALYDETFLFCLKRAVVVMLPSLLIMSRKTALFAYKARLVWTSIMVALTMNNIAGDAVYSFYWRLYFTFLGCVIGIVCWYCGNGHGSGNPYGFTAATSVVMFFLTFYRHFHKQLIPTGSIILLVTVILVVGISWTDKAHLSETDTGPGWKAGWMRFVTVFIGLSIAMLGSLFPRPKTGRRQVRINLGKCMESLLEIHANISSFAMQRSHNSSIHIKSQNDVIKRDIQEVKTTLLQTIRFTIQIQYEPPLSGIWPKYRYQLLIKFINESVVLLDDIYHFLDSIENTENIPLILQRMGWTSIELTSGMCTILGMSSRALAMALPLPTITPRNLSEIYALQLREIAKLREEYENTEQQTKSNDSDPDDSDDDDDAALKLMFQSLYNTHDGRHTLALITTCTSLYRRLDGCLLLVKGLVGESFGVNRDMFSYDIESSPLLVNLK